MSEIFGVISSIMARNPRAGLGPAGGMALSERTAEMRPQSITVPLSQGKYALIDADDASRILAFKWCFNGYAYRTRLRSEGDGPISIYMHRVILGVDSGVHVDHINGNKLDNRKRNLRGATQAQNRANTGMRSNNTSGFVGVSRSKAPGRWDARIRDGKKQQFLGTFSDPAEAARVYDEAARIIYGEFARLNFPGDREKP